MPNEKDFLSDEYPSMNEGGEKQVPEEFRNTLDTANVERREKIIESRVDALRSEAFQSGAASAYEVDDMAEALRNELEGEVIDVLFGYKPKMQGTDYQRLKGRVDEKLGRSIKTENWANEEEKLNELYPSMSTDPRREYRKALGLGAK